LSPEGHDALIAILTDGDVFEAGLIERFANTVGKSGDFVAVCEHPARIPTASNATITTDNLSFFIFPLYEFELESQTALKAHGQYLLPFIQCVRPGNLELKSLPRLSGRLDVNRTVLSSPFHRSTAA
jgi:hypothetical protein